MQVMTKTIAKPAIRPECSIAHGTAKREVPIIVFQIAILKNYMLFVLKSFPRFSINAANSNFLNKAYTVTKLD